MIKPNQTPLYLLIAGFTVWSLAFVVLYALQALGCVYNWGALHRPVLIGIYALCILALFGLVLLSRNKAIPSSPILSQSAIWANWAALFSGAFVFLPVTFVSACT